MEKYELNTQLEGLNVVLVTGDGCASCVSMVDVVKDVSERFKQIDFYILEYEEKYSSFLENYKVRTIPSVLIIKNNKLIDICHGYQPDEILEIWLDSKISSC